MAKIFPTDFEEKLTIAEDDYILFSDSEDWNRIKKAQYSNLKWEDWNWVESITSSKEWKTTTVTITETNGEVDTFQIQDWEWAWDVIWPSSSTDWHLAVFDWATWKLIKDGGAKTTVVNNLNSTSTTAALSANQGRILDGKIAELFGLWKFLSLWNSTTWLPISFPLDVPYTYTTWDYFLVETVWSTNYKPTWSSYTWTASSTAETEDIEVWDIYIYDGQVWLLQLNHGKSVSFANITWQPTDNVNLATALWGKQDTISDLSTIRTNATNWATVVSGDTWVTYTIKVSNSDPASWTASNIITLVP
jgi:hypothetical protein